MHWSELHSLFSNKPHECTNEERRQNVIDNPHIVDWFFDQSLQSFIKHWLYGTLEGQYGTGTDMNSKLQEAYIATAQLN